MMLPFHSLRYDGSQGTFPQRLTPRVELSVQTQSMSSTNSLITPSTVTVSPSLGPVNQFFLNNAPFMIFPSVTLSPPLFPPVVDLRIPPSLSLNQSPSPLVGPSQPLAVTPASGLTSGTQQAPNRIPLSLIAPQTAGFLPPSPSEVTLQLIEDSIPTNPASTNISSKTITLIQETTCDLDMSRGFPLPVTPYGVVGRDVILKPSDTNTLLDGSKKEFMITRAEKVSLWRTFADVFHEKPAERLEVTDKSLLAIFLGLPSHVRRSIQHKGGIGAILRECPWFLVIGDTVQLVPTMEKLYLSQEDDIEEASAGNKEKGDVPDSWEDLYLSDIDEGGYTCLSCKEDGSDCNHSLPKPQATQQMGADSTPSKTSPSLSASSPEEKHRGNNEELADKKCVSGLKWNSNSIEFVPSGTYGFSKDEEGPVEVWDEEDDEDIESVARHLRNEQISQQVDSCVLSPQADQGSQGYNGSISGVPESWETLYNDDDGLSLPGVGSNGQQGMFGKSEESWDDSLNDVASPQVFGDKKTTDIQVHRSSPPSDKVVHGRKDHSDARASGLTSRVRKTVTVDHCNNLVDLGPSATETGKVDERHAIEREKLEHLKARAQEELAEGTYNHKTAAEMGMGVTEAGTQTAIQKDMVDVCVDCSGLVPSSVTTGVNTDPVPGRMECFDHCKRALACCKSELQKVSSEHGEAEGRLTLMTTKLRIMEMENKRLKSTLSLANQQLYEARQKPATGDKSTLTDVDLFEDPVNKLQNSLSEAKQKILVWNLKNVDLQSKLAYQLISQAYEESEIMFSMTKMSLARKATLTTQLMRYQSELLINKEKVDEWKQRSERILTMLRSADTLPPFPHIDIKKFTPEVKPQAPLRLPNNPPSTATVKLAANLDGPMEPSNSCEKRTVEDMEPQLKAPPGGFMRTSNFVPNQAKAPLTSTFTPNEKSDRPGTGTTVAQSKSPLLGGDNLQEGYSAHQSNHVLGSRLPGGRLATAPVQSSVAESHQGSEAFGQPGQSQTEGRGGLPSDHVILDFGTTVGNSPLPMGIPCYPNMMPLYPTHLEDPTPLFGKIDQMIESFAQDGPPNFGGDPLAPSRLDSQRVTHRPTDSGEMRGGGDNLRRKSPGFSSQSTLEGNQSLSHQMTAAQGRAPSPYQKYMPAGSDSQPTPEGKFQSTVSSTYGPRNHEPSVSADWETNNRGLVHAAQGRAPSPYKRNTHAGFASQSSSRYDQRHVILDDRQKDSMPGVSTAEMERASPPFRRKATPSSYRLGEVSPVDDQAANGEQRTPSPYQGGNTPSPHRVRSSFTTRPTNPVHDQPTAALPYQGPSVPVSAGLQSCSPPYRGQSVPVSPGLQRCSLVTEAKDIGDSTPHPPNVDNGSSSTSRHRLPTEVNGMNREVENTVRKSPHSPQPHESNKVIIDSPSKVGAHASYAEKLSSENGKTESPINELPVGPSGPPSTIGKTLSPEEQKVSFNKSTIRPPSQVSKKAKNSVRANLGLDTFEGEVPKRGRVAEDWMQGVSVVKGESRTDEGEDSMEGWSRPGNKRKKRAVNERQETKTTTTSMAAGRATMKPAAPVEDDYIPSVFSLTHLLKKLSQMFPDETSHSLTSAILKVRANHRGRLDNVHFNVVIAEVVTVLTSRTPGSRDRKRGGVLCKVGNDSDLEEPPLPPKPHQNLLPKLLAKLEEKFPGKERQELIKGIVQVRKAHGGTLAGITMVQVIFEVSQYMNSLNSPQDPDQHDDSNSCIICLGSLEMVETVRKLECEHKFHNQCIQSWFQKRERTCPVCRSHALLQDDFPRLHGAANTQEMKRI